MFGDAWQGNQKGRYVRCRNWVWLGNDSGAMGEGVAQQQKTQFSTQHRWQAWYS